MSVLPRLSLGRHNKNSAVWCNTTLNPSRDVKRAVRCSHHSAFEQSLIKIEILTSDTATAYVMWDRFSFQWALFKEGGWCPLDITHPLHPPPPSLAVFSGNEWQLMNTTSAAVSPWRPLLSQFAGGCLGDESEGDEGRRGREREGEKDTAGGCHTSYQPSAEVGAH